MRTHLSIYEFAAPLYLIRYCVCNTECVFVLLCIAWSAVYQTLSPFPFFHRDASNLKLHEIIIIVVSMRYVWYFCKVHCEKEQWMKINCQKGSKLSKRYKVESRVTHNHFTYHHDTCQSKLLYRSTNQPLQTKHRSIEMSTSMLPHKYLFIIHLFVIVPLFSLCSSRFHLPQRKHATFILKTSI